MKILSKKLFIFACMSLAYPTLMISMDTTFQTPSIAFLTPRFNRNNLTTFDNYVAFNKATASYDCRSNSVPLFNFVDTQMLFTLFVDPVLNQNIFNTVEQASISGRFESIKYNFRYIQNIGQTIFFSLNATFLHNTYNNIQVARIKTLSQNTQQLLRDYLGLFDGASCQQNIIGPQYITIGYTNSWTHFSRLDFLDFTIQTGMYRYGYNPSSIKDAMFDPFACNNLGIPIMANLTIGLYDWLNIGGCALVIPFLSSTNEYTWHYPLNNVIRVDHQTIQKDPFVYCSGYLEADQMIPHLTLLAGFSYIKQHPIIRTHSISPKMTKTDSFEICNMTLQAELDFAKDTSFYMPRVKFVYVCPLWGHNIFKTAAYGEQIGIEIAYEF